MMLLFSFFASGFYLKNNGNLQQKFVLCSIWWEVGGTRECINSLHPLFSSGKENVLVIMQSIFFLQILDTFQGMLHNVTHDMRKRSLKQLDCTSSQGSCVQPAAAGPPRTHSHSHALPSCPCCVAAVQPPLREGKPD